MSSVDSALHTIKTTTYAAYEELLETHLPSVAETLTQWATATYGHATTELPKFCTALTKASASPVFPTHAFLKKHASAIALLFLLLVLLSLLIDCVRERSCPAAPPAPSPVEASVRATPQPQSGVKAAPAAATPRAGQSTPVSSAAPAGETPKMKTAPKAGDAGAPTNFATGP